MDGIICIWLPRVTTHNHLRVMRPWCNCKWPTELINWDDHVSKLYTDCAYPIGYEDWETRLQLSAFWKIFIDAIRPRIEYACALWSGGSTRGRLQRSRTPITEDTTSFFISCISKNHGTLWNPAVFFKLTIKSFLSSSWIFSFSRLFFFSVFF